ncbi:MAG: hypothetical protein JOY99_01725 [Sphingomonadaceae bacterium]|nr:hypothetical protein [Sphingomonadaceae bacterium]
MARTLSLIALFPAMIAVTPATAQAVGTSATAAAAAQAADPASNASQVSFADAPQPHSVRIAGKTVAIDSLPSNGDVDQGAKAASKPEAKSKPRAHR